MQLKRKNLSKNRKENVKVDALLYRNLMHERKVYRGHNAHDQTTQKLSTKYSIYDNNIYVWISLFEINSDLNFD